MPRQNARPIYIPMGSSAGQILAQSDVGQESDIQAFVQAHPEALPIAEIDPAFVGLVPICTELNTPAGPIDNFMVTPAGLPVLVECKLWRNPQARREVVGQVLDYAKELARWTSADVEREAARRGVPSLFEKVREASPDADEADFHDALTANLARGRCLLLIVGDGIREGVEAIFEHLRNHAALHFSLGLVEMPIFEMPEGGRLVLPRVLARTVVEVRKVYELPKGFTLDSGTDDEEVVDPANAALGDDRQAFWREFLRRLKLDDPEQPIPRAPRQGYITLMMPAPGGSCWVTVYRSVDKGEVGAFLSCARETVGQRAVDEIARNWSEEQRADLGGSAIVIERNGYQTISEKQWFGDLSDQEIRSKAIEWLAERANAFVNVFRPAVRSAVADLELVAE